VKLGSRLHARVRRASAYSGTADWDAVASPENRRWIVPVLGNGGHLGKADDALRMVRETGCDGVVVGRGCLGRPWLFCRPRGPPFAGRPDRVLPTLGEGGRGHAPPRRTARRLVGCRAEAVTDFRKHVGVGNLKGFPGRLRNLGGRWAMTSLVDGARRPARQASMPTLSFPGPSEFSASHAAGRTLRPRSCCRTAGSMTAMT